MSLKLEIVNNSTVDCATAILTLPEIPDVPIVINLANMSLDGKLSSCCFVAAEVRGEAVEHLVKQRRQIEDCRHVLAQLRMAPSELFIDVVLRPVVGELSARLGLSIALPAAVKDPLSGLKALANSAAVGLVSYKQLSSDFGYMKLTDL